MALAANPLTFTQQPQWSLLSGLLLLLISISLSLFSLYLFSACWQQSTGDWRLQCWENFVMGSAFMWPLVCRHSCYPGYCQETRLRLGHEWQTIFIISNDTQKEIPFQASYLFQQPARTKAVNETSKNFTVPKCKDHNITERWWMDLC